MEIGINTDTFGTTGLPYFGVKGFDPAKAGNIEKVNAILNRTLAEIKGLGTPGGEADWYLTSFANHLMASKSFAETYVAGMPVVRNV